MEDIKKEKKHPFKNILIILLIILLSLTLYARFIGTTGLYVREYSIINDKIPSSFHGLKIIHFTDLHHGTTINISYVKKLVKTINSYKPDIIFFTGDLIDKDIVLKKDEVIALGNALSELDATIAKYAVKGNHDYENDYFDKAMEIAQFKVLDAKQELIYYHDETPLKLIGLPSYIKEKYTYEEENTDDIYFTILLAHEPDVFDRLNNLDIDIMLSGHSHGGQVRIPFFGAIITPYGAKKYYDEYYKINDTEMFISSGLGTSDVEFRFMNRPSINLYRLYSY